MLKDYYEDYWVKRETSNPYELINKIPKYLLKYSVYGAIINDVPENSLILDAGCGDGRFAYLLKKLKKCEVYGIDISENSLKIAEKNEVKIAQCDLNIDKIPFNKKFDVILAIDVIEHLLNPVMALKQFKNSLKPNGKIIISTPNFARLGNRINMLFGKPRDMLHFNCFGDGIEHYQWFTKEKLIHFGKLAGLEKNKVIACGLPFDFLFAKIGLPNLSKMLTYEFT